MKIKNKLALHYTSITIGILIMVFVFVYTLTTKTINNHHYSLLAEKALLTAQKHFEKDELSEFAYQRVLDAYQEILPGTTEEVIISNNIDIAIQELQGYLSEVEIEDLFNKHHVDFELNDTNAVAIYYEDNEGNFVVIVSAENTQGDYISAYLKRILIIILLASSLLIFLLLRWDASIITKPLEQMVTRMKEINAKDMHIRLDSRKGNDELAETINYFNQMIERLEISFNSQKTFIANASHELKNPLTAIVGECEVMQLKDFTQDEYKEAINRIETETERISLLVNNLLQLAQADLDILESDMEDLNITNELQSVVDYFNISKYKERIIFNKQETDFYIKANKHLLFVALQNLIENACKYSEDIVEIKSTSTPSHFSISIIDKGIGIPADEIDKVLAPFYRAKNTYNYKGAGIGLSLVSKILALSNATLTLQSTENEGTTATITWIK